MGSIQQRTRADGSATWRVMFRDGGRQRSVTFDNEDGAVKGLALLDAAGVETAMRVFDVPDAATTRTVGEQLTHHIEHLSGVQEGTRSDYRRMTERDIAPHLGPIPLTALTRDDVAAWVNALEKTGLSPKSIKNRHSLLSGALTAAQRDKLIGANPAKGVRLPRGQRPEMTFLTRDEFARLVDIIPKQWRPLVALLAGTGMRWSEATALQVQHIDLDARTIAIRQAWKHTDGDGHRLGPPKTFRANRTVAIPTASRDDLARLIAGRGPNEFVFTSANGGPVRHTTFHSGVWTPAVHEFAGDTRHIIKPRKGRDRTEWERNGTGKRPRIHDLRHSFASWAIQAGHSLTAIQRTMGHESIQTTSDTYGHLARSDQDAFAELIVAPALPELPGA